MKNSSIIIFSFFVLINLVITGVNIGHLYLNSEKEQNSLPSEAKHIQTTYIEESSIIESVEKLQPSVVSIIATKELEIYNTGGNRSIYNDPFFRQFFGFPERLEDREETNTETRKIGGGSGFIYSSDGLVVTNKHVVSDTDADYTVILYDGTELMTEIIARDPYNDVAILQIKDVENIELIPIEIGSANDLKIGQKLIAIGNALAEFQNTVTTGILSARGRDIQARSSFGRVDNISNLLQTDAAINQGNSGGPLTNLSGQVIGINTAIAGGAEGIGFAIPIDDVISFIQNVDKNGEYVRPFLGVRYVMLTEDIARNAGLDVIEGAFIYLDINSNEPSIVPNSPADKSGIQVGDIIIAINEEELSSDIDLRDKISQYQVGDTISVTILRNNNQLDLPLTLESFSEI